MTIWVPSSTVWQCHSCGAVYHVPVGPTGYRGFNCYCCGAYVWKWPQ